MRRPPPKRCHIQTSPQDAPPPSPPSPGVTGVAGGGHPRGRHLHLHRVPPRRRSLIRPTGVRIVSFSSSPRLLNIFVCFCAPRGHGGRGAPHFMVTGRSPLDCTQGPQRPSPSHIPRGPRSGRRGRAQPQPSQCIKRNTKISELSTMDPLRFHSDISHSAIAHTVDPTVYHVFFSRSGGTERYLSGRGIGLLPIFFLLDPPSD